MIVSWNEFGWFALASVICWAAATAVSLKGHSFRTAVTLAIAGLCIYATFIILFWTGLQRPPLRTIGETRLWYSFFMILSGTLTYIRWRYRWIMLFSTVMAIVFIAINLLKPEIHDESLMPALQSAWFIPHVTVYMFSYSVLGCAFLLGLMGIVRRTETYLPTADQLVYIGTAFLTFGMLSGALWAKEAWENYWSGS